MQKRVRCPIDKKEGHTSFKMSAFRKNLNPIHQSSETVGAGTILIMAPIEEEVGQPSECLNPSTP